MRTETVNYTVPVWMITYLLYGDLSGMNDDECTTAGAFEQDCADRAKSEGASHWHYSVGEEHPEFSPVNDVTGHEGGEVVNVEQVLFFK